MLWELLCSQPLHSCLTFEGAVESAFLLFLKVWSSLHFALLCLVESTCLHLLPCVAAYSSVFCTQHLVLVAVIELRATSVFYYDCHLRYHHPAPQWPNSENNVTLNGIAHDKL